MKKGRSRTINQSRFMQDERCETAGYFPQIIHESQVIGKEK